MKKMYTQSSKILLDYSIWCAPLFDGTRRALRNCVSNVQTPKFVRKNAFDKIV